MHVRPMGTHRRVGDFANLTRAHIRDVAAIALRHRLRRDPLDDAGSGTRVQRIVEEVLG